MISSLPAKYRGLNTPSDRPPRWTFFYTCHNPNAIYSSPCRLKLSLYDTRTTTRRFARILSRLCAQSANNTICIIKRRVSTLIIVFFFVLYHRVSAIWSALYEAHNNIVFFSFLSYVLTDRAAASTRLQTLSGRIKYKFVTSITRPHWVTISRRDPLGSLHRVPIVFYYYIEIYIYIFIYERDTRKTYSNAFNDRRSRL